MSSIELERSQKKEGFVGISRMQEILLNAQSLDDVRQWCAEDQVSSSAFQEYLENIRNRTQLLTRMLLNINRYRFPLAVIVANTPYPNLPERFTEELRPQIQPGSLLRVEGLHPKWALCYEAGKKLQTAIDNGIAIKQEEGTLLIKPAPGRVTALCLKTFSTQNATFVEGNWYSPVDKEIREKIRECYIQGNTKIDIQQGIWTPMRAVLQSEEQVFNAAKQAVTNLPERMPYMVRGMSRRDYLNMLSEQY